MTDAAWALIEEGRGPEAHAALEAASRAGDPDATHLLATLIARGAWTPKDWSRSLQLLALAAAQGSAEAAEERRLIGPAEGIDRLLAVPERRNLCESPRVRQIDGFVSPDVCAWLIERAKPGLARAATMERDRGRDTATPKITENRTNSAASFAPFEGGVLMALITERIAGVVKVPTSVFEAAQVFHYATGQEFRLHTDYVQIDGGSQRIATFLIYLNEDFDGGETWFPRAALKARARTGGAVYFANVDLAGRPDPMTLHAGAPPTRGEKWLFSQWIRDRPYTGD